MKTIGAGFIFLQTWDFYWVFYESYTIILHYFLGFINKVEVLFEFILEKFPEFLLRIFQGFF